MLALWWVCQFRKGNKTVKQCSKCRWWGRCRGCWPTEERLLTQPYEGREARRNPCLSPPIRAPLKHTLPVFCTGIWSFTSVLKFYVKYNDPLSYITNLTTLGGDFVTWWSWSIYRMSKEIVTLLSTQGLQKLPFGDLIGNTCISLWHWKTEYSPGSISYMVNHPLRQDPKPPHALVLFRYWMSPKESVCYGAGVSNVKDKS